jgi:hypothetical protein
MRLRKRTAFTLLLTVLAIELVATHGQGSSATARRQTEAAVAVERTAQPGTLVGSSSSIVAGIVRLSTQVLSIADNAGGSLSNGRWRLDIPAGVVDGAAAIGLGVPNSTSFSCQLDILSADPNHIRAPARLTVDCAGVPVEELERYVLYALDPAVNAWQVVPGSTVDLTRKTVSAALRRFSTYAVGTSGGKVDS